MTNTIGVGWYLFSTDTDKYWNELKKDWGLEYSTVYQYIYELSSVPISDGTALGNDNWTPINISDTINPPLLTKYKAYWVRVDAVSSSYPTSTIFYTKSTAIGTITAIVKDIEGILSKGSYDISMNDIISVTIGSTVTSISGETFTGATNMTSVTIPEGVTSIGPAAGNNIAGAFQDSGLTSIHIPKSVSFIGCAAILNSDMTIITVDPSNESFSVLDNVLFNKDQTELFRYPPGNADLPYTIPNTSYTIPASVTTLKVAAFERTYLTSITIPNTVETVEDSGFFGSTSLSSVTFAPNSKFTTVGANMFRGATRLTSINIPASLTTIGWGMFNGATSLSDVTFESDSSLNSIEDYAFYNTTSLTTISIPKGVTSIASNAFGGSGLTSVSLYASTINTLNLQIPTTGTMTSFYGSGSVTINLLQ